MTATFAWRQSKRSQPRVDEACLRTYSSHFSDVMEMLAPVASVSDYLDAHQEWFTRCAAPMTVQPLDVNAYRLQLGKFGNFGFEVEPKIDLVLLPQQQGVYRIETLPPSLPLDEGYSVDFQASLELCPQSSTPWCSGGWIYRWRSACPLSLAYCPRPWCNPWRSPLAADRSPDLTPFDLEGAGRLPRPCRAGVPAAPPRSVLSLSGSSRSC